MKAVIYARYSSDRQTADSIAAQVSKLWERPYILFLSLRRTVWNERYPC